MIIKRCVVCGSEHQIDVTPQQIRLWNLEMHIQDAMPNISPSERELFLSGICGTCYDKMCEEIEEEELNSI